jgi:hypothetical protein
VARRGLPARTFARADLRVNQRDSTTAMGRKRTPTFDASLKAHLAMDQ